MVLSSKTAKKMVSGSTSFLFITQNAVFILLIVVPAVFVGDSEAQFTWPANKCAFACQNYGLCNQLSVCACEPGWMGVDCSIPAISPLTSVPHFTRVYSYFNRDASTWNSGTNVTSLAIGAVEIGANNAFWTQYPFTQTNFILTATLRILKDTSNYGVMLLLGNRPAIATAGASDPYGIKWASFTGIGVLFSKNCNGLVAFNRTSSVSSSPSCTEGAYKVLSGYNFASWQTTFRVQIVVRYGLIAALELCTIAGCVSPFVDVDLSSISLYSFTLTNSHLAIGSGPGSIVDVFEYRIKEMDYSRDYSLVYGDYFTNNWVRTSGSFTDPPGFIRVTNAASNSFGAIYSKLPMNLPSFKVTAVVEVGADAAGNSGRGFGIFLITNGTRSPTSAFGVTTPFTGIGVIVAPATNASCVISSPQAAAPTFYTNCSVTNTYKGSFNSSTLNFRTRLTVMLQITSTTSTANLTATLCFGALASTCHILVSNYYIGTNYQSMQSAPTQNFYLALGGSSDATYKDSIDVLEVKVYTLDDTSWLTLCKNGGYLNGSLCICLSGWTGSDCSTAICASCTAPNRCIAPSLCVCPDGYGNSTAPFTACSVPKCRNDCPLHAACTAPNVCTCISGWTGFDCSQAAPTKSLRTIYYGPSLMSGLSLMNTSNTANWQVLQPASVMDLSLGGVRANSALRIAPSAPSNRGAIWSLVAIGKQNVIIRATVEMGRQGVTGDGFTIALVSATSLSKSTTYTPGTEYMILWNAGNKFQGAAFNVQPFKPQVCIFSKQNLGNIGNYNSGAQCAANAITATEVKRKFEVTAKVRTTNSKTYLTIDICNTDGCYYNITSQGPADIPTSSMYLGISVENNAATYDSFDIYDVETSEMVFCSTVCSSTGNYACTGQGTCACKDGYSGANCNNFACPGRPSNTDCLAPLTWSCKNNWFGPDCSIAICSSVVPKYGVCTNTPNTISCIAGYNPSACTTPTFVVPYYANLLSSQSFTGLLTSLSSNFNLIPTVPNTTYGSLVYAHLADSSATYQGAMFSKTTLIAASDYAVNVTIAAVKPLVDGGYYGIYVVTQGSISLSVTGAINWPSFTGLAVLFTPKSGQVCFIYSPMPLYSDKNCQVTGTLPGTISLTQKVRIGIVSIQSKLWVDVCSIAGCANVFSGVVYSPTSSNLRSLSGLFVGITAYATPSYSETVDVYELLAYQIPYCTTPCANGGKCVANNVCNCTFGWTGTVCTQPVCNPNCTSHGVCMVGTPNYCNCSTGWAGVDCGSAICSLPCQHNGNCTAPTVCTCATGWNGTACERALCTHVPYGCQNGGNCTAPDYCTCSTGWLGTNCTTPTPNVCTNPVCSPYGTCTSNNVCTCAYGWNGTDCWTPICSPNCEHGACILADTCSCHSGWTGFICFQPICSQVCVHGSCVGPDTCNCDPGWTGQFCDSAICSACYLVGGTCNNPDECTCNGGWCGDDCSTPLCDPPCDNNGNCTSPDSCSCPSDWTDSTCTTPICSPPCMNGGTCVSPDVCSCTDSWADDTCLTPVCSGGCVNGLCSAPETCACDPGWSGDTCSNAVCDTIQCNNGGACSGPNTCTCADGWFDQFCTTPICNCQNNGTCIAPYLCNCTSNWTNSDCSIPACTDNPCVYGNCTAPQTCACWSADYIGPGCDIPVCTPTCANGGTCIDPNNCTCVTGWTGSSCETPICNNGCQNGGNCTGPDTCTCLPGWGGLTCEAPTCNPLCNPVGGSCLAPPTNCSCRSGWTGGTCYTPICSSTCLNGGNCSSPNTCTCVSGWIGPTCATAVCNSPCNSSGGSCLAPNNCSCFFGWTGNTCSTPICSGGCGNGTCTNPGICTCNSGFTGSDCSTAVCSQGCANGGNCSAPGVCICDLGWNGTDCKKPICISLCLNGGFCTSPNNCTCRSGFNGTQCENVLCNPTCQHGGTCLGNNACACMDGWIGGYCETLNASIPFLETIPVQTNAFILENIASIQDALASVQPKADPVPASDLLDSVSDVISPSNVAKVVQSIIEDPFADDDSSEFSEADLEQQAKVIATLNSVTQRINGLGDDLPADVLANLTEALVHAADQAAAKALQRAIALETAIVKSDRFDSPPELSCTPLIAGKEKPSVTSGSVKEKLDALHGNFSEFIDGMTIALLRTPLVYGQSKVLAGEFYSVTIGRADIASLSGYSLQAPLGGIDYPIVDTRNADFVRYRYAQSFAAPALFPETPILLLLSTYVSNILDSESPYNFPTVTVRIFTTTRLELAWASTIPLHIQSKPPNWNKKQFSIEKSQSQCNPDTVHCDLTTNADSLGTLVTFPMPSNAGDFLLAMSGDQTLPYDVYIGFKEKPTISKYTWVVGVSNNLVTVSVNSTLAALRYEYDKTGQLRVIIPQKAISVISAHPVTKVIEATPALMLYVLIIKRLGPYSVMDDLPSAACEMLKCEGFYFRIYRIEPTKINRKKRQISVRAPLTVYEIQDLELESNSSETALSFHAESLGTFTADLLIVPNTIEFATVMTNFETLVADNSAVIALMATSIGLFLLFLIPLYIYDKRDLKEWAFLPTKSNSPKHKYHYLISIHCHKVVNHTLKPKVDIRLFGDFDSTDWRWLNDGIRKNFTTVRPSNFILTTYKSLGTLEKIELSVSSELAPKQAGDSLEIEFDRVLIIDVASGRKYPFLCRSKLGASKRTKEFKLAKEDDIRGFDYLFPGHSRTMVTDAHMWLSLVHRPVPSNWTRCERLACIISAFYLAMLTNAMFYGQEPTSPRMGVNVGGLFRISMFTFWTSLYSCLLVLPPTALIAFIFQFVRRRSAEMSEYVTAFNLRLGECNDEEDDEQDNNNEYDTEQLVTKYKTKSPTLKTRKRKCQLPFCFLVIAWLLVAACIGVSAFIVTVYSLQWGQEKSLQWLCGMIIQILQDILIIQTAKVFVFAIFNAGKLSLPDDGLDIGTLTFSKKNTRRRVEMFEKLRFIATGLGHHVLYVLAFALVIGATTNEYAYPQVLAVKPHLFIYDHAPLTGLIRDQDVIFKHWLFRIIPNFLNGNQAKYGLVFAPEIFYDVPNHDVMIIGPIRIRQIRAAQSPCAIQHGVVQDITDRFSVPLSNNTYCHKVAQGFDLFGDTTERRIFNGSWNSPVDLLGTTNLTKYQEAWTYREPNGPSYTGEYGTYESSGYYVDLPTKLKPALKLVAQLQKNRWLDNNTTAIFVDFNLYNPQTNVFVVIKIVYESLTTGGMMYQVRRNPLKIYQYSGSNATMTIAMQAFWIAMLLSQIFKMCYKFYKNGVVKICSNKWNLLTITYLAVGIIIVGLFTARIYVTEGSIESMNTHPEDFTNLDNVATWEELMFNMYGFAFFLAMVAFFQYLESNKYWAIFLATLSKGRSDILAYSAFFVMVTAIFAIYFHILVGSSMAAFSSYKTAILTLLQRIVGSTQLTKLGFPDMFSKFCSMIYSGAILTCGGQVFIAIINKIYGRISQNVEKETDWDGELASYMADEFGRMVRRRKECDNDNEEYDNQDIYAKFDDKLVRLSNLVDTIFGSRKTSKEAHIKRNIDRSDFYVTRKMAETNHHWKEVNVDSDGKAKHPPVASESPAIISDGRFGTEAEKPKKLVVKVRSKKEKNESDHHEFETKSERTENEASAQSTGTPQKEKEAIESYAETHPEKPQKLVVKVKPKQSQQELFSQDEGGTDKKPKIKEKVVSEARKPSVVKDEGEMNAEPLKPKQHQQESFSQNNGGPDKPKTKGKEGSRKASAVKDEAEKNAQPPPEIMRADKEAEEDGEESNPQNQEAAKRPISKNAAATVRISYNPYLDDGANQPHAATTTTVDISGIGAAKSYYEYLNNESGQRNPILVRRPSIVTPPPSQLRPYATYDKR